jgi:hypothetical protein
MTGREVINSKLVQIRKILFLALFIIPIIFCLSLFFSKHSVSNLLSSFIPIAIGSSYIIWLYYQAITIPCPFCDKKIPWEYSDNFKLLSNDYKYCPYCRTIFDEEVNDESKINSPDNLQKYNIDNQNVKNKMTGRNAINATLSRNRFRGFISIAIILLMIAIGHHWWESFNTTFSVWVFSLVCCLIIKFFINLSSWALCPFCGKRICLLIRENDKWKLGSDFLFCQKCGVSIDEQL